MGSKHNFLLTDASCLRTGSDSYRLADSFLTRARSSHSGCHVDGGRHAAAARHRGPCDRQFGRCRYGRVLSRPLDAAPVHDADDADSGAELNPRRGADVQAAVARLSRLPRTPNQVFALSCLVAACLSYLYWGLAIALGPLVSIYFAREAEKKGIEVDFPFLLATTSAAGSVWQFGLSASAPLLMNTPGHFLEKQTGLMPLSTTIWAPATFVFLVTFFLALIVAARFLHPSRPQPLSQFPDAFSLPSRSS